MSDLTVLQAKRYEVITCSSNTTLKSAAQRMADEDISSLVVVDDEGYLLGILSRTDLLRAHRAGGSWALQPVSKHMTQPVVAVTPVDRLSHVADLLLDKQIHRVVVVREENGKQRPVAVISDADLVYHMTREA